MPFASGSVSCVIYRVTDALPDDFSTSARKGLERYAFRPIRDERGEDRASGWVNPLSLLDPKLEIERLLLGEYLYLGVRIDRKTPNRALLNARVQTTTAERLRETERKRLSADERQAIRAEVRNGLLAETSASTAVYETLWNVEAGWLFFSAASATANGEFLDLFASTFGLDIIPMLPYTYADTWASEHHLTGALESLEPAAFHRDGRTVRAPIHE